jgi:hypothetical protein
MDLALTQAKLNLVVQKYVTTDYQTEASAFVAQFISDKSSQADQMTKVVLTQASRLSESLGIATRHSIIRMPSHNWPKERTLPRQSATKC